MSRLVMTLVFVCFASIPEKYASYAFGLDDSFKHVEWLGGFLNLIWWKVGYVIGFLAGVTDFFDGYIARKYNLITDFGKLMDPLSDKVHTISSFVVLTANDIVPIWVTCIILTREFAVTGLRTMAAKDGVVIAAKNIGKVKTVIQMLILAFGGCFWVKWLELDNTIGGTTPAMYWIWKGLLWSIALLTVYSGAEYFWKGRSVYAKEL
jgi:CDP-diacylglycerol--glycerol-3-phosphate 3-phosphatidyltransferase